MFSNRPLQTKLILCKYGQKMSARDESCTTGTVQSCQQYELIVSWHVGPEEARAGGGFIPLGAAWSSARVLDLVIRLWGRATQRKSPLNSEEALKACSSLHQKRRGKKSCSFFFFDAGSDTAGQCTKDEKTSRSFDLNPVSHCVELWLNHFRAGSMPFTQG